MDYSHDIKKAVLNAMLSGGLSGALGGGAASLWKAKNLGEVGRAAALGAGAMGGLAAGSTYLGEKLLGVPQENDPTGYTSHGAMGGVLGGAGAGALAGMLLSRGKLPFKVPENLITKEFTSLGERPLHRALTKAALMGGIGGAGAGGYVGMQEGMGLDFLESEMKKKKQREMEEQGYEHE